MIGLCKKLGLSWFDVVIAFHEHRQTFTPTLKSLYKEFRDDSVNGIWETGDDLVSSVKSKMGEYLADKEGTNEMAKGKAKAIFNFLKDVHDLLFFEMEAVLGKAGLLDQDMKDYLKELKVYSELRKIALLDSSTSYTRSFTFDFLAMDKASFIVEPREYKVESPIQIVFKHNEAQISLLCSYIAQYGTSLDGLGRILMRTQFYDLIRIAKPVDSHQLFDTQANLLA